MTQQPQVIQLRLVVGADDCEEAVHFYRDVLGLTEQAAFEGDGGAKVTILDAGRATLELANPAQRRMIDEAEVGHPTTGKIRVAFEVDDTPRHTDRLVANGPELVAPPTRTPWHSLNSRMDAPAGLHPLLGADDLGGPAAGVRLRNRRRATHMTRVTPPSPDRMSATPPDVSRWVQQARPDGGMMGCSPSDCGEWMPTTRSSRRQALQHLLTGSTGPLGGDEPQHVAGLTSATSFATTV